MTDAGSLDGGILMTMHRLSQGGADRVGVLLANGFVEADIPTRLLLLRDGGEGERALLDILHPGVTLVSAGPPMGSRHLELLRGVRFIRRQIASENPSLVLASSNNMGLVTGLSSAGTSAAMKVTNPVIILPRDGGPIRSRYRQHLYGFVFKRFDRVLTLTEAERRTLSELYPGIADRFETATNAYITPEMLADHGDDRDPGEPMLVTLARMMPQKRLDVLLRAFAEVQDRNCRLTILGDGPERPKLEHLAASLGVTERVDMPGFVEDVLPWLRRADLFVLTSDYEGLPAALLEALACNVPVVTTDCFDGTRELLAGAEGCSVVPKGDIHAISAAIDASLASAERSMNLRDIARGYDIDASITAHVAALKPLIDAPRKPEGSKGTVGQIYGNLAKIMSGKAAAGIVSLVYMVVAIRALGVRDYGVLILVHTYAITVGGIIEFPGWQAVVRYGAQAAEAGDPDRLIRLLRFTSLIELACGAVAVFVAAVLAPYLGPRLGWSPTAVAFAVPYSFAVLATIRSAPAGYLQLVRRFDLLGWHNLISPMIRLGGALIAWASGAGLHGFLVAWLVAALAEWASMWLLGWIVARQQLARARLLGSPRGAVADNPGIRKFMLAANADVTLGELAQRIGPLAVGWALGPAAAGIYAVAQRATTVIAQPAGNLGQAAYAELARIVAAGARGSEIRQVVLRSVIIAFGAAIPFFVLIVLFGQQLAQLLGGKQLLAAGTMMVWLVAARTVLLAGPPASAALVALGRPGLSVVANSFGALAFLPFLPFMLSRFGLAGAGFYALASAIVAATALILLMWRTSHELPLSLGIPQNTRDLLYSKWSWK